MSFVEETAPRPQLPPSCRFFLGGACRKGLDCPFSHDAASCTIQQEVTRLDDVATPMSYEYFVEEGIRCTFGPGVCIDRLTLGDGSRNPSSSLSSSSATVSISGLPPLFGRKQGVTEQDIEARLSPFGRLLRLSLVPVAASSKKRSSAFFALATFSEAASATAAAVALHGSTVLSWSGVAGHSAMEKGQTQHPHHRHQLEQFNNAVSVVVVQKDQSTSGSISSNVEQAGVTVKVQWYAPSRCAWIHFPHEQPAKKAAQVLNGKVLGQRTIGAKFQAPSYRQRTSFTTWIGNLGESVTDSWLKSFTERHVKCRVLSLSLGDLPFTEKTGPDVVQRLLKRHGGELISFEKDEGQDQRDKKAVLKLRALVRFANTKGAEQACRYFEENKCVPDLGGSRLFLQRLFAIKFTVPTVIFEVIKDEVVSRLNEGLDGLRYNVFENASSRTISIKADRPDDIASIKAKLDRLMQGLVVRDPEHGNRAFWTRQVQSSLFCEKINRTSTCCCVWPDTRRQEVRVFGPTDEKRSLMAQQFLSHCKDAMIETHAVPIARHEFEYILQNGRNVLDNAQLASKARKVSVDIKNRSLLVEGSLLEARRVKNFIYKLVHGLGDERETPPSGILCPVCFCPPENIDEPHGSAVQLSCGHCYCRDCFDAWLSRGTIRDFPLICLNEDCSAPIALNALKEHLDTPTFLATLRFSVDDHVRKHTTMLQFCIIPTCPGIYSITEGSRLAFCSTCFVAICTDCKVSHGEISCEEHRLATQPPDLLRMRIVDEILTLRCPRCHQAFLDFDGCFALTCSVCPCRFCGWCLTDCGTDAHDHVKSCPSKAPGADTYFGTKQQFAAAQTEKRRKQVSEFLNKLSPGDRNSTLASIRNDLADLGIQL